MGRCKLQKNHKFIDQRIEKRFFVQRNENLYKYSYFCLNFKTVKITLVYFTGLYFFQGRIDCIKSIDIFQKDKLITLEKRREKLV